MLDIRLIREQPDSIRKDLQKRSDGEKLSLLEDVITLDREYLGLLKKSEEVRAKRNSLSVFK